MCVICSFLKFYVISTLSLSLSLCGSDIDADNKDIPAESREQFFWDSIDSKIDFLTYTIFIFLHAPNDRTRESQQVTTK